MVKHSWKAYFVHSEERFFGLKTTPFKIFIKVLQQVC